MKKKYIKPTIIDLSIEGMTGFGYGVLSASCGEGFLFTSGSCNPGTTAGDSCSYGTAVTNGCTDGSLPSDGGIACAAGNGATGRFCESGIGVSGYNPSCANGEAGIDYSKYSDCSDGLAANYCDFGNNNIGPFS